MGLTFSRRPAGSARGGRVSPGDGGATSKLELDGGPELLLIRGPELGCPPGLMYGITLGAPV